MRARIKVSAKFSSLAACARAMAACSSQMVSRTVDTCSTAPWRGGYGAVYLCSLWCGQAARCCINGRICCHHGLDVFSPRGQTTPGNKLGVQHNSGARCQPGNTRKTVFAKQTQRPQNRLCDIASFSAIFSCNMRAPGSKVPSLRASSRLTLTCSTRSRTGLVFIKFI